MTGFTRADAQLVTARWYGFASWADPGAEDCSYHATPLGWAEHFHHQAVAEYPTGLTAPPP